MAYPASGILTFCGLLLTATWVLYSGFCQKYSETWEMLIPWVENLMHFFHMLFANIACISILTIALSTRNAYIFSVTTYLCFLVSIAIIYRIIVATGLFNATVKFIVKNNKNSINGISEHIKSLNLSQRMIDFYFNRTTLFNLFLICLIFLSAILIVFPVWENNNILKAFTLNEWVISSLEIKELIWLYSATSLFSIYNLAHCFSKFQKFPTIDNNS